MPEGRMLKRVISESKSLGNLSSDSARLLYTWLIPWLDVEGRHSADPDIIKGHVFPKVKAMTTARIEQLLGDLAAKNLIVIYGGNGEKYLQFTKFAVHQKLNKEREAKSNIPAPTAEDIANSRELMSKSRELTLSKDKLSKDKLRESAAENPAANSLFEEFWKAYPREGRVEKKTALAKFSAIAKAGNLDALKEGFRGYMEFLKHQEVNEKFKQRAKNAKTFLNHYDEYSGFRYEPKL